MGSDATCEVGFGASWVPRRAAILPFWRLFGIQEHRSTPPLVIPSCVGALCAPNRLRAPCGQRLSSVRLFLFSAKALMTERWPLCYFCEGHTKIPSWNRLLISTWAGRDLRNLIFIKSRGKVDKAHIISRWNAMSKPNNVFISTDKVFYLFYRIKGPSFCSLFSCNQYTPLTPSRWNRSVP